MLDLDEKIHRPFHKPNANVVYVNQKSNHPPQVLKNIPTGVEIRLSKLSSNEACFNSEKPLFQKALNEAGYQHEPSMKKSEVISNIYLPQLPSQYNVSLLGIPDNQEYPQDMLSPKKNNSQ